MAKDQFFELFVSDLEEIFFAESLLVNSIPKFIEKATDEKLREALKNQSEDIQQHIVRLNTIFDNLHETPSGEAFSAMEGLIKEGSRICDKYTLSAIRDAAIVSIFQRIAHYQMAIYGTLRTYAKQLEYNEISEMLQLSLNDEGNANKVLTDIAKGGFFSSGINKRALEG